MVQMAEVNDIRTEILKHPDKGSIQWRMYIPVLVIRHVYAPYEDGGHELIRFFALGYVLPAGEFLARKHSDLMALPGELMA
jgi:hypothetical protein